MSNGITIGSVTYNSSTSLTLNNVSFASATTGAVTITVNDHVSKQQVAQSAPFTVD